MTEKWTIQQALEYLGQRITGLEQSQQWIDYRKRIEDLEHKQAVLEEQNEFLELKQQQLEKMLVDQRRVERARNTALRSRVNHITYMMWKGGCEESGELTLEEEE